MSEATAAVMVIRYGNKFLTVPNPDGRSCPGGKREESDTSTEHTAVRETREESGFIVEQSVFIFQSKVGDHLCDCYYATRWTSPARDLFDSLQCKWLGIDELTSRVPGEIRFPEWNSEMVSRISEWP